MNDPVFTFTADDEPQQYTRVGVVDGVDLRDTPDPDALVKCMLASGFPKWMSAMDCDPALLLSRVVLRPEANRVNVRLYYEKEHV